MANVGNADVVVRLALEQLNADLVKAAQQIQSELKDAQVNVKINTDGAAEQAKQAGLTVQEAIDQGIAKIDADGRLRDLSGRFIKVGEDGKIAGDEIGKAFEAAGESSSSIARLAESLGTSYGKANQFAQALGLTSEQASQAVRQIQQLNSVEATLDEQFAALSSELGLTKEQFAALSVATKEAGESGKGFNAFLEGIAQGVGQQAIGLLVQSLHQTADALKGLVEEGLRSAQEFNSAGAAVATLGVNSDAVGKSVNQLAKDLNYQVSATELLKSSYDVFSARTETLTKGLSDQAAATDILKAAVIGAKGGFSDTNTVADALTTVLNSYGLSAAHAAEIVDKLAATQNAGKIQIGQYAAQIGRLAPVAAQAGVSLDELNGFIATATVKGVPVESTFAGIRQAIAAVLKPTTEAQSAAQALGIQFDAAALKTKGLSGILGELSARGLDTQDNLFKLFGSVEAVSAIAPATGAGFKTLSDNIKLSEESAGTAQQAYEKVAGSLEGRLANATGEAQQALLQFGQAIQPVQSALIQLFGETLGQAADKSKAFDILAEAAQRFSDALENDPTIAENLGTALAKISDALAELVAQGLDTLIAKLKDPGFGKFVSDLTTGFEGISAAIGIVINAANALGNVTAPINTQTLEGVNLIGTSLKGLNDLFNLIIQTVEDLGARFAKLPIVSQLLQAADAAGKLLDKLNQLPGATPGTAQGGLSGSLDKLKPAAAATAGEPAPTQQAAELPKPADNSKQQLTELKQSLAEQQNAIKESYAERQSIVSTGEGNINQAEQSYYDQRIAANKAAIDKLKALEASAKDPKVKAQIEQQITALETQNANDRLAISRKVAQSQTQVAKQSAKDQAQAAKDAAKEAVDAVESANRQAEAAIKQSQSNRVIAIKQAQLEGKISAQDAANQIAQIEVDSSAKTIAQKQKELASVRSLRAQGNLDAKQAADKESALIGEIAQLNQGRIEKEIALQRQLREQYLDTLQIQKDLPLQQEAGQLELQQKSLQSELSLAQAGADLQAKQGQLAQERLKTQIQLAQAAGNEQQVTQLNLQLKQQQRQQDEQAYQAKLRQLDIEEKLQSIDLQRQKTQAQIAANDAEIAVMKAQAEGKSTEEIAKLQQVADLQKQQIGSIEEQQAAQQQLNEIKRQGLEADRAIALEQQKQADIQATAQAQQSTAKKSPADQTQSAIARQPAYDPATQYLGNDGIVRPLTINASGSSAQSLVNRLQSAPAINLPGGSGTAAGAAGGSSQIVDAIGKGNDAIVSTLKQVIDAINKTGSRPSINISGGGNTSDLLKFYNDLAIDHNRSCS